MRFDDARGWICKLPRVNTLWTPKEAYLSYTRLSRTMRGMHMQDGQEKVIHVLNGQVYDVLLNPKTKDWYGQVLQPGGSRYIPEGHAHGFVTDTPDVLTLYYYKDPYDPTRELGIRWDDPWFGIVWPSEPIIISEKDASWPNWGS